jgi:hypothetical protein
VPPFELAVPIGAGQAVHLAPAQPACRLVPRNRWPPSLATF